MTIPLSLPSVRNLFNRYDFKNQDVKQWQRLLPAGLVEICTQASCAYGTPQIHHRPFLGRPVCPYQAPDPRVTAVLCQTHAMQNHVKPSSFRRQFSVDHIRIWSTLKCCLKDQCSSLLAWHLAYQYVMQCNTQSAVQYAPHRLQSCNVPRFIWWFWRYINHLVIYLLKYRPTLFPDR